MGFLLDPHGFNPSPFEARISAEGPIFHARFRDGDFISVIADSSGNNRNLVKQIAAATRSDVKTRTTHPGGALFPSVTLDNWGTQGTFYKRAAESLLSGATEYTALISFRMIKAPSNFHKAFGLGTENVAETGDNDLAFFKASSSAPVNPHYWKNRTSGGLLPVDFAVTEKLEDGVNRLATVRYDSGTLFRLMTSKPGHEGLVEETASNSGPLKALSRALILNARSETNTGPSTTLEMVVDQIALFDTDIGATAEADLHSKWMDEVAGAGYYPSMMQFDGSTGYYSDTTTTVAGNQFTLFSSFTSNGSVGNTVDAMAALSKDTVSTRRFTLYVGGDGRTAADERDRLIFLAWNDANTVICYAVGTTDITDGEKHTVFIEFDSDAGTLVFKVDEADDENLSATNRVAPTAGDMQVGTMTFEVGASLAGAFHNGNIGAVGYADTSGLDPDDFMDGNLPKPIDEKDWTEFGGTQPAFWAHDGALENNKGSAGDMTLNGGVTRTTGGSP